MNDQSLEGFASPDYFFTTEVDCSFCANDLSLLESKKFLLPELAKLFNEDVFATVSMGWNHQGLLWRFEVTVGEAGVSVSYPELQRADSIELFIDTRDMKTARSTHRFCHHFFFLPEAVEGVFCGEISRFRTEDSHPLCKSSDLELKIESKAHGYIANIVIPKECLVGFDPSECRRIGFGYRINRFKGSPQHFGVPSTFCSVERHPYLWSTILLEGNT